MKKYNLDKEELEILEAFENREMKKSEDDLSEYMQMAKNTVEKTTSISLRVNEKDLTKIKSKAIQIGVPYQTLIKMMLHQVAENKLVLEI
ncbi:MAG: CopG family antitoxin [Fusobacteriaceae bacterium]